MYPYPPNFDQFGIGCEAKYELTKKRCSWGISGGQVEVFGPKRVNCYCISETEQSL